MAQSTVIYPNIIQSLDDLKILVFWKIIKDNNYLLIDRLYTPEKEYSETEKEFITQIWHKLYDDYFIQCNDSRSKRDLRKDAEELTLAFRIETIIKIIELMGWLNNHKVDLPEENYIQMMMDNINLFYETEPTLKGKLNIFSTPIENITIVNKYLSSLQNKYARLVNDKPKRAQKQIDNVYNKVLYIGTILGIQLRVDEMSCSEWLAAQNIAYQKQEAQRKANEKGKGKK